MSHNSFLQLVALLGVIILAIGLSACGQGGHEATSASASGPSPLSTEPAEPPSHDEIGQAVFTGVQDEPVQLTDGLWEGEPFVEGAASRPTVGLVRGFHLTGDLTGDGNEESIVLLWTSSGGSGTFDYLAVAGRVGEEVSILGTAQLGDRVQVRAGQIADRQIVLDVVQAGPEDAACCPTRMAKRVWELGPEGLGEVAGEIMGAMTLAELRGPEWLLTDIGWDEPAPAEPEVTLVFEEERIAGGSGCNRYFGGVEEGGDRPNSIAIGQIGATRMMCSEEIMAIEDRFLFQLGGVAHYSFLAGKLALTWKGDGTAGVMLFKARPGGS